MKTIMRELLEDLEYLDLPSKRLILAIFLCFGSACFISGFVTGHL